MKFTNAYSLLLHLFNNGLLKGINLGLRGEYTVNTTIQDPNLLNILNDVFGEWRWSNGGVIDEGYYELVKDENGDLAFAVNISTDILDFWGNPFEIEDILKIIVDELALTKIDLDEYLEYQLVLDLELDYPDTKKTNFKLEKFEIYSATIGDEIDIEIKSKLKEFDLLSVQQVIVDYLIKVHMENHEFDFTGFWLSIQHGNSIGPYYGKGHDYIDGLKESFEEKPIDFELK
jgi:hypothetical protein